MYKNFKCSAQEDLPYPPVEPRCPNCTYANEILSNVGGQNSEMTAVSLYFYNHVILEPRYSSFAECFFDISVVEMNHLEIFAELALKLGADPRLWSTCNCRKVYWSPEYNDYPMEIHDLIINSIKGEEEAIKKYQRQIRMIDDPNIVAILKRIIMDEECHIQIFKKMLASVS